MLVKDSADLLGGHIPLIGLRIDRHQDKVFVSFKVIDDPIATALAALTIAIGDADLEESDTDVRDCVP
jgi:hypothetical protein